MLGWLARTAVFAVTLMSASAALAQTLTIGIDFEPPSLDPHLRMITPDEAVSEHFFDALIFQDENQRMCESPDDSHSL